MIARPLELASRLRPEPRNLDALFYVNAGLLVLFFALFQSRWVLAPGLRLDLPAVPAAAMDRVPTTHYIRVIDSGTIYSEEGPIQIDELVTWLRQKAAKTKRPMLLVQASANVKVGLQARIYGAAAEAGFGVVWAAEEQGRAEGGR